MTARDYYDPDAGPWVAYMEREDHGRSYVWNPDERRVWQWTGDPTQATRFDTKAEALEMVRRGRGRVAGVRTGAERVAERPVAARKPRCAVCGHLLRYDGAEGWICSARGGCGSEWHHSTIYPGEPEPTNRELP